MTPQELLADGWHEFAWNNGIFVEYWKSITEDEDFDYRVGVRFGEWRDKPFIVYFVTRSSMTSIPKIKTLEQLNQFYAMVMRD